MPLKEIYGFSGVPIRENKNFSGVPIRERCLMQSKIKGRPSRKLSGKTFKFGSGSEKQFPITFQYNFYLKTIQIWIWLRKAISSDFSIRCVIKNIQIWALALESKFLILSNKFSNKKYSDFASGSGKYFPMTFQYTP